MHAKALVFVSLLLSYPGGDFMPYGGNTAKLLNDVSPVLYWAIKDDDDDYYYYDDYSFKKIALYLCIFYKKNLTGS